MTWLLVQEVQVWVFHKLLLSWDFHTQQSVPRAYPEHFEKKQKNIQNLWAEMPCW